VPADRQRPELNAPTTFWAVAVFGAHFDNGVWSALKAPSLSSAGFWMAALFTTGHSLLPSAK
jgi:hypothetical protein